MSRRVHEGFAERFKQSIDEAGLGSITRKELGEMFGVSPQAVQKWLRGESMPTAERAPHVAGTLGVRRAWLLDAEPPMRAHRGDVTEQGQDYDAKTGLSLSGEEFKLVTLYRKLPPKMRLDIANLLTGILKLQRK